MSRVWKLSLLLLLLVTVAVWTAVFSFSKQKIKLIACDVGQGDSTLLVYGTFQILTDGGLPNGKVLGCLSRHMPFWDRNIEVIVNTHPQLDHYGGLIDVIKNYNVQYFVANALESSSQEYQLLKKWVGSRGITIVNPIEGQGIRYGMIRYDIFFPSFEFLKSEGWDGKGKMLGSFSSKKDPNDFSIQSVISFGEFKALLTGDIGENMKEIVSPHLKEKSINYIKIPHHGSKYGLTRFYIDLLNPKVAVIQVGKNTYGHPTSEILQMLKSKGIKIFRNDESGDIILESDGNSYRVITEN